MDLHEKDDLIRIFVFRPYVPIFLKRSKIQSYENLLNEISNQYGVDIESLHLMSGMEIKNSDQLKHDKVYIGVEKECDQDGTKEEINDDASNNSTSDESSSNESLSNTSLCKQVKAYRRHWSKQSKLVTTSVTSREDVLIYVHSLYTYKNELLPYGCTLKFRDLQSMEQVLTKIAIILKPPGRYIMGLYDIHKNEITNPSQLKNKHHYLAMPHIISYNGYKILKNLSPQTIREYNLSNHEEEVEVKKDYKVMKNLIYEAEKIRKDQNTIPKAPKVEEINLAGKEIAVELRPGDESSDTIREEENNTSSDTSSSSQNSSQISYYTMNNKSNHSIVMDKKLKSDSDIPDEISYYTCSKEDPSKRTEVDRNQSDGEKCCDVTTTGSQHDSRSSPSRDILKNSIMTITEALGIKQDAAKPVLKKTSHYTSLKVEDSNSDTTQNCNCRKELAENILETVLHDIQHGKIKSPLLDPKNVNKDTAEAEIVEPLLLSCDLIIDIFQRISKSLNEQRTQ